jgi:hypothetical protein
MNPPMIMLLSLVSERYTNLSFSQQRIVLVNVFNCVHVYFLRSKKKKKHEFLTTSINRMEGQLLKNNLIAIFPEGKPAMRNDNFKLKIRDVIRSVFFSMIDDFTSALFCQLKTQLFLILLFCLRVFGFCKTKRPFFV